MASDTPADGRPLLLVLFGSTGDLAKRKLYPALFQLHARGLTSKEYAVIGSGRHSPGTDDDFREIVSDAVKGAHGGEAPAGLDEFTARFRFQSSSAEDGEDLARVVRETREGLGADTRTLLYLSVPPASMSGMLGMIGSTGLSDDAVLVMEKPFGEDVASACALNKRLHEIVPEERVFRVDHFLGKEAVRNLLALRLANGWLESVWNREHLAYVQIDVPEEIDIEGRASFMESTGTFRDMIPTHLGQVLGIVALDLPERYGADELREARTALFRKLRPFSPDETVFGQYEGYREEEGVAADSTAETFVALRAWIDDPRWEGVPFLLRTGKAMGVSRQQVTIGLREASRVPGADYAACDRPSEWVFDLTDPPRFGVEAYGKRPGTGFRLVRAPLMLDEGTAFPEDPPLTAYARVFLDALAGDPTWFTGAEEIERLWEVCADVQGEGGVPLPYARGSFGPTAALELAGKRGWRVPEK
ncbi:glucose-6-phosphate dehydrogenase [Streptomyces sp. AM 3-1-1]|uniref:glucose-6-phosphate dehydrogenase n=1 Tax=Streptomyces sp. AM 3-1-1 TaxID=3028711 RepID=UPI0023B89C7A|nr:glucose-6-phosphate dehydrogenase [Streptomyces sp. AM 3-1-1]WEH26638.1 glucose-6-phosphate dehydrogenase [Streptomyces sp. AM 3-1-1]